MRQGGKVMKKFLSQMEWEHVVPFSVGARTGGCVYLEPKPNKVHTMILEKDPTKRVVNGF